MNMELDELKPAWRELDHRIDAGVALNRRLLAEFKLDKTQSALRRWLALPLFELLSGVVTALLLGSFLAEHIHEAKFAAPALVLHALTVFYIAISVWQLAVVGGIDYSSPVVAIQRKLAQVRAVRVRTTQC